MIDEDQNGRDVACDVLTCLGYESHGAADGVEGLALLHQCAYDVVVASISMSAMTGVEVAKAVRRRTPMTRVILMTGAGAGPLEDDARAQGWPILAKPFKMEDLKAVVADSLRTLPRGSLISDHAR